MTIETHHDKRGWTARVRRDGVVEFEAADPRYEMALGKLVDLIGNRDDAEPATDKIDLAIVEV